MGGFFPNNFEIEIGSGSLFLSTKEIRLKYSSRKKFNPEYMRARNIKPKKTHKTSLYHQPQ